MKEIAKVIKTEKSYAVVSIDKKDECSKCGMCMFPKNASKIEMRAQNAIGANVGDSVVVERNNDGKLLSSLLIFLVPLFLIGISVAINYLFIKNELALLGISVALIAVWYFVLSKLDKKLAVTDKFSVKIVEILNTDITKGEMK